MPGSSVGALFFGTALSAAVACVSFPASATIAGDPTTIDSPQPRCEEPATSSDGKEHEATLSLSTSCASQAQDDQSYLLATASPGGTMVRQGPETAIARLNPEFVARLASAIREARTSGLPAAGIFSAYRPPAFGIGGFSDKFRSLHAYGLAVDMSGIGEPGSKDAKLWHEIAARHDIFCPYGYESRTEWNHCQPIPFKGVADDSPLRKTITAQGPVQLDAMFTAGSSIIDDMAGAISVAKAAGRPAEQEDTKPNVIRVASASREHLARASHDRLERTPLREARHRPGKAKLVALAMNVRHEEKSHRGPAEEAKVREPHRAARAFEGHRDSTRRHTHLA